MKVISFDLDKYAPVANDIDIEAFLILYCKYYDKSDYISLLNVENLSSKLVDLEILHYIKITEEMYYVIDGIRTLRLDCFELRAKANDLFLKKSLDLESLSSKLRDIFPAKVRGGGGKLVKSPVLAVVEKLKKFYKYYPNAKEEDILKATTNYIENRRRANWAYITQLDYFIFKDNVSMLASEIESLEEEDEINVFEREA